MRQKGNFNLLLQMVTVHLQSNARFLVHQCVTYYDKSMMGTLPFTAPSLYPGSRSDSEQHLHGDMVVKLAAGQCPLFHHCPDDTITGAVQGNIK